MTVETTATKMPAQNMNGVTLTFPFTFRALVRVGTGADPAQIAKESIKATITNTITGNDTELVYTTDYTTSIDADGIGGSITVTDAQSSDYTILIYREYDILQGSDYEDRNSFPADTLEDDLDLATMINQQQREELNRSLKAPITSTGVDYTLPSATSSNVLGWNSTATGLTNYDTLPEGAIDTGSFSDGDLAEWDGANGYLVGNSTLKTDVADNTSSILALETAYTKFSANSGNLLSGEADILDYTGATLKTKTGGAYDDLVVTNANGTKATISSELTLDMSSGYADGTYNILIDVAGTTLIAVNNTIYTQPDAPSSPATNDIWYDTSVSPQVAKQWNGASYDILTSTPIGQATAASNVVTAVESNPFNQNGYEVNTQTVKKYDSGWFAVTINTTYTKTHNLGTSNIKYIVLVADDANGTNQRPALDYMYNGTTYVGWVPREVTSSQLSIITASNAVSYNASASATVASAYYRILAEVI